MCGGGTGPRHAARHRRLCETLDPGGDPERRSGTAEARPPSRAPAPLPRGSTFRFPAPPAADAPSPGSGPEREPAPSSGRRGRTDGRRSRGWAPARARRARPLTGGRECGKESGAAFTRPAAAPPKTPGGWRLRGRPAAWGPLGETWHGWSGGAGRTMRADTRGSPEPRRWPERGRAPADPDGAPKRGGAPQGGDRRGVNGARGCGGRTRASAAARPAVLQAGHGEAAPRASVKASRGSRPSPWTPPGGREVGVGRRGRGGGCGARKSWRSSGVEPPPAVPPELPAPEAGESRHPGDDPAAPAEPAAGAGAGEAHGASAAGTDRLSPAARAAALSADPAVLGKCRAGFREGLAEVNRFLAGCGGVPADVRSRLLGHLAACLGPLGPSRRPAPPPPAAPGVRPPLPLAAPWVRLRAAAPARPDWGAPQRPQGGAAEPGRALEAVAAVRPGPSLLRRPRPVLGPRSEPGVCFERPRPDSSHLFLSLRSL